MEQYFDLEFMLKVSAAKEIEELKYRNKPIILEFQTEWCPPCRQARKIVDSEIMMDPGSILIATINCDQAEELVLDYQIKAVPTYILLNKHLKPVDKLMGFMPDKIKAFIKKAKSLE